jgi:hypothetical protein
MGQFPVTAFARTWVGRWLPNHDNFWIADDPRSMHRQLRPTYRHRSVTFYAKWPFEARLKNGSLWHRSLTL